MQPEGYADKLSPIHTQRFDVFDATAPLFVATLRPLAKTAPTLLDDHLLTEPLFATLMVNPGAFRTIQADVPNPRTISDRALLECIRLTHWFWSKHPERAIFLERYDKGYTKKAPEPLWPIIEDALRYLYPTLGPKIHLPRDLHRVKALRNNDVRAYLATLACLIIIATRRAD
ncbi:MAG: hypothetical protein WA001_05455 [Patescibacteria group bacterium]